MDKQKALRCALHCIKVGADMAVCEDCEIYPCDYGVVEDLGRAAVEVIEEYMRLAGNERADNG